MISDNQFFFVYANSNSQPMRFIKFTFGSTSTDWSNKIAWTFSSWSVSASESLISKDKTKIYSIFIFGVSSAKYMYMTTFDTSSGKVVDSRYKSSISIEYVYGAALNGDYLVASLWTLNYDNYIMIFNLITSRSIIKKSTYGFFGCGVELLSGR